MGVEDPAKKKERAKRYYRDNLEKVRAAQKRWREANKAKITADKALWNQKNPEKIQQYTKNQTEKIRTDPDYRRVVRANKYKIAPEALRDLEVKSGGRCKICGAEEKLCIDHNHTTGSVRGLLCSKCNRLLGMVRDDPQVLAKAIEYLNESLE